MPGRSVPLGVDFSQLTGRKRRLVIEVALDQFLGQKEHRLVEGYRDRFLDIFQGWRVLFMGKIFTHSVTKGRR